jgi:hypothetical protein
MGRLVWRARKRNAGATAEVGPVHGTTVAGNLNEALPGKVAVRHRFRLGASSPGGMGRSYGPLARVWGARAWVMGTAVHGSRIRPL